MGFLLWMLVVLKEIVQAGSLELMATAEYVGMQFMREGMEMIYS